MLPDEGVAMRTWSAIALALTLGCGGSTSVTAPPSPAPSASPTPSATFAIVSAQPAAGSSIVLPSTPGEGTLAPTLEFQFTYPRDLTLGVGRTNFQVGLVRSGTECLATQIAYATRLDRADGVYVAGSVARFRTGTWVIRDPAQFRCGTAFTTEQVVFNLGPDLPVSAGLPAVVTMGWSFAVR
jgi:ABC-type transport system substrate-binding protein